MYFVRALILIFIFLQTSIFYAELIELDDNYKMCTVNSNINLLNIEKNCFKNKVNSIDVPIKGFEIKRVERAYVFSKHNFILETKGIECKMIVRVYRFKRDVLFNKFVQNDIEIVTLSKHDCNKMVAEKKCGDFTQLYDMQCTNNNTCWFKQKVVEEFPFYFGTIEKRFFECHLNEKIVLAQDKKQNIFHNSKQPCLAEHGVCFMAQSTIIWKTSDIKKCPYERLIHLNDLQRVEDPSSSTSNFIVQSKRENYLFKLVKKIEECDIEFYSTSEGMYLSFYYGYGNLRKKLENIPISKYEMNHFTDRDKNDLLLAEHDFENYQLLNLIEQLECSQMINSIRQNLHLRDTFIRLNNYGN